MNILKYCRTLIRNIKGPPPAKPKRPMCLLCSAEPVHGWYVSHTRRCVEPYNFCAQCGYRNEQNSQLYPTKEAADIALTTYILTRT